MRIEYVGHACFALTSKNGARILIDPYDDSIGLKPVHREADILLITHHHYDHDNTDAVSGNYELIDQPGQYCAMGADITGIEIPHDDQGGAARGMVTAFLIATDGMRILHMSDVGTMPDDSFFETVGKTDILMIPVGGTYTVDARGAMAIMDRLRPNITIPMHFKTTNLNLDITPVHPFLALVKKEYDISHLGSHVFDITADSLKKRERVLLMENSY